MTFSRRHLSVLAMLVLTACTSQAPLPAVPAPATASPCWRSPLTDMCGESGNPVVIAKIDDVEEARPQFNLNSADVVVVEQVEGGLTRLFAVYQSKSPEFVGPIRSARITDLDLAPAFGTPAFAYSGSAARLVPYLKAAQIQLIGAPQGGDGYFRIDDRAAPHNYLATLATLRARVADASAASITNISSWPIAKQPLTSGIPVTEVAVRWPASKKSYTWDGSRWQMTASGQPLLSQTDLSGTTEPVTAANVLVMQAPFQDSPFSDKYGAVTPYANTIGTGDGYVLSQGTLIHATWERLTTGALPRWFDEKGTQITLTRGRTWWLIVSDLGSVTYR